jgi:AcrR family transcriptional regulator
LTIANGATSERRYGGRTAEQRRADRRERLLDAGLQLFGTQGYAATTIEGLCAAASLNARYFYEQFRNREELLAEVYRRHVEAVMREVTEAIGATADPAVRLEAGLRAFVEATLADERGARINYFEMVGVSPGLEQVRRGVDREYAEMITAEAARLPRIGARPREQRRAIAVALVGAVDGLIIDWLMSDRAHASSTIVDTLLIVFGPTIG